MMVDNTTELLSVIVKAMSEEGVELTSVELYAPTIKLNNEVKVKISNGGYIIHKINERGGIRCELEKSMVNKVLELLKKDEWLPGDDIEAYGEWYTLVVEESSYLAEKNQYQYYRLLDKNYSLSDRMTLEDLRKKYTNASLEKRLKGR